MFFSNWYKEPDEEKISRSTKFFHKLDNSKWKLYTGARARKQKHISIYISLYMKTFSKTVYIYIYIIFTVTVRKTLSRNIRQKKNFNLICFVSLKNQN